jgi:hypothetical protein
MLALGVDLGVLVELDALECAPWWLAGSSITPITVGTRVTIGFSHPHCRPSTAIVERCERRPGAEGYRIAVRFDGEYSIPVDLVVSFSPADAAAEVWCIWRSLPEGFAEAGYTSNPQYRLHEVVGEFREAGMTHPAGLAVDGDALYVADQDSLRILQFDIPTGALVRVVVDQLPDDPEWITLSPC